MTGLSSETIGAFNGLLLVAGEFFENDTFLFFCVFADTPSEVSFDVLSFEWPMRTLRSLSMACMWSGYDGGGFSFNVVSNSRVALVKLSNGVTRGSLTL